MLEEGEITKFAYAIGSLLVIAGLVGVISQIIEIAKWMRSKNVDAIIVGVSDETWNDGRVRFRYRFVLNKNTYTLWGPWYETFNPILCVFPQGRLGKTVKIHIDSKKMKILQSPFISSLFFIVGLGIAICGIIILLLVLSKVE